MDTGFRDPGHCGREPQSRGFDAGSTKPYGLTR